MAKHSRVSASILTVILVVLNLVVSIAVVTAIRTGQVAISFVLAGLWACLLGLSVWTIVLVWRWEK